MSSINRDIEIANKDSNGRWDLSYKNSSVYIATFIPPETSIYYGGIFFANITIPLGYPTYPPRVKMTTKIYHPNFSQTKEYEGGMYVDVLYSDYKITFTLAKLMEYIWNLFSRPDADSLSQCNNEASHMYKTDRVEFEQIAKEWTAKYAQ